MSAAADEHREFSHASAKRAAEVAERRRVDDAARRIGQNRARACGRSRATTASGGRRRWPVGRPEWDMPHFYRRWVTSPAATDRATPSAVGDDQPAVGIEVDRRCRAAPRHRAARPAPRGRGCVQRARASARSPDCLRVRRRPRGSASPGSRRPLEVGREHPIRRARRRRRPPRRRARSRSARAAASGRHREVEPGADHDAAPPECSSSARTPQTLRPPISTSFGHLNPTIACRQQPARRRRSSPPRRSTGSQPNRSGVSAAPSGTAGAAAPRSPALAPARRRPRCGRADRGPRVWSSVSMTVGERGELLRGRARPPARRSSSATTRARSARADATARLPIEAACAVSLGCRPCRPCETRADPGASLVVTPTYDEAENLEARPSPPFAARCPSADILVVDDASPDGTGDARRPARRRRRRGCTCCTAPRKDGLGRAYLAGFAWALEHGYDVVVEMDADGSHPADALPAMLDAPRRPGHRTRDRLALGARRRASSTGRAHRRLPQPRRERLRAASTLRIPVRDVTAGLPRLPRRGARRASTLQRGRLARLLLPDRPDPPHRRTPAGASARCRSPSPSAVAGASKMSGGDRGRGDAAGHRLGDRAAPPTPAATRPGPSRRPRSCRSATTPPPGG